MRIKLIPVILVCLLGLGIAAMTGCGNEKKSNNTERVMPLLLLNQQQSFFPEIPKGVAE